MSVDAVSQLMQQNALKSLYGNNSSIDSGNNIDFSTLLGDVMQTSANQNSTSATKVNGSTKVDSTDTSSQTDKLDELEKLLQLQSLQSMSSAYNTANSLGSIDDSDDDSSSLGLSSSGDYGNEMMDSIFQLLSQNQDQNQASKSSNVNQNISDALASNLM
jgi:hypothetical protein